MKSFDSRTYSINDFVEWDKAGQLTLNPAFQRRPVWTDKAKSFLMDTIIRGKPIPKIFIRQVINVSTKTSIREVVDGQQRLRTILSYIKDGFKISISHNPDFGNLLYSQLPDNIQAQILSYEVSVDLLINLPDAEILDIFSRLNSYSVILNEQEKINADHFGPFKSLADKLAHKYHSYWTEQNILSAKQILRMQDISLVADILISTLEGIKSKKQIKKYYDQYEVVFEHAPAEIEEKFDGVMQTISLLYPEGLGRTELSRYPIFYSLFTAVFHCLYGLPHCTYSRPELRESGIQVARNGLDRVEALFGITDVGQLSADERQFRQDARLATTDEKIRLRRLSFILTRMG